MSATMIDSAAPLGESQIAARRKRLADLALIVFELITERHLLERSPTMARRTFEGEEAKLIEALRSCSQFTNSITCLPFDNLFVVQIRGVDGHDYIVQFPHHGPGFSLHASRVRVMKLSLAAVPMGEEGASSMTLDILDDHSERIKLGGVTTDRAFLVGMSMVIGLMDERGEDEDETLSPLVQFITPTREELRQRRENSTPPIIELDDDPY